MNQVDAYNQLSFYTLSHKGQDFIHQHVVDAFTIQTANEHTKPIAITYALIGVYLHVEKKYTGKQVQLAHISMSKKSKVFDTIKLPEKRGDINIFDVINVTNGSERDELIHLWCKSIWEALSSQHQIIMTIAENLLT